MVASTEQSQNLSLRLRTRGDLTAYLSAMAQNTGADNYLLLALPHPRNPPALRILASSWVFDAIELAGSALLVRLATGGLAAAPGEAAQPLVTAQAPDSNGAVTGEEARLLHVLGHGEIWTLRIQVGQWRFFVLLSAPAPGLVEGGAVARAQLECGYALSQVPGMLASASAGNPLSERERECLFWVSEGKTTEEVSVILGVAANTVNSYITHAMQKLSASNRPMAVATAIRGGII